MSSATIRLRDKTITTDPLDDRDRPDWVLLRERWLAGRSGGVDLNYRDSDGTPQVLQFDYADIQAIDITDKAGS